jgi:hypothetical protein
VTVIVISTAKTATDSFISYCRFDQQIFVPQMLSVHVTYIYPWESNNEGVTGSNDGIKDSLATKKLCRCGGGGGRLVSIRGQIFINDYGSHDP